MKRQTRSLTRAIKLWLAIPAIASRSSPQQSISNDATLVLTAMSAFHLLAARFSCIP